MMDDKCKNYDECGNKPVFYAMVENDDDPTKSHIEQLCETCAYENKAVIDTWTSKEWDDED